MKSKKIAVARAEATRFLERIRDYEENPPEYEFVGNKESGALKRASMDLTRALADLRRQG